MQRRFIWLACIFISVILYLSGVYILSFEDLGHRSESLRKESPGEENPGKENPGEDIIERLEPEKPLQIQEDRKVSVPVPVNVLVLGLDDEETRSDTVILLNFNPADGKLNILSIARDTRVYYKEKPWKINAMMAIGGERLIIDTVEKYTRLPVHYYVTLNFKGFREIVDALGGVEYYVPFNMDYDDPAQNLHIHLKKGWQVLDGRKAEQLVRYRKGNNNRQGYEDGDLGRIKTQQEFIKAFIRQKANLKYISKLDDIFLILKKHMRTNIEIGDIGYYIDYLKDFKYENVSMFTLPGDSAYVDGISYFICDWKKARELIDENFSK